MSFFKEKAMGDVVTAGIVFLQMIEKQLLLQRRFVVSFNAAADAAAAAAAAPPWKLATPTPAVS